MNLLLDDEMHGTRPKCWNHAPREAVRVRHGIDSTTGKPIAVTVRDDWSSPECATWKGVGVGQPTAEYPTGVPYPIAKNWSCAGCRWLPEGVPA